jgi:hypothetical protein
MNAGHICIDYGNRDRRLRFLSNFLIFMEHLKKGQTLRNNKMNLFDDSVENQICEFFSGYNINRNDLLILEVGAPNLLNFLKILLFINGLKDTDFKIKIPETVDNFLKNRELPRNLSEIVRYFFGKADCFLNEDPRAYRNFESRNGNQFDIYNWKINIDPGNSISYFRNQFNTFYVSFGPVHDRTIELFRKLANSGFIRLRFEG